MPCRRGWTGARLVGFIVAKVAPEIDMSKPDFDILCPTPDPTNLQALSPPRGGYPLGMTTTAVIYIFRCPRARHAGRHTVSPEALRC